MSDAVPFVGRETELKRLAGALVDDATTTIVITGAAGIGKSALAAAALRTLDHRTHFAVRLRADTSSAIIPYGVFASFLPSDADLIGNTNPLRRTAEAIVAKAAPSRLVIGIDDAQHLDGPSAALLRYLNMNRLAKVVLTLRSGSSLPEAVSGLLEDPTALSLGLRPFDRSGVRAMAEALLEGESSHDLANRLWDLSLGNPLLIKEVLIGGQATGIVRQEGGRWHLQGEPGRVPGLREMVERRISHLDTRERSVLELLAVGQPVNARDVEELCGATSVDTVERARLVTSQTDGRRTLLRLAHPLYGEVIASTLTTEARCRWQATLATRLRACGSRRREDLMREAVFRANAELTDEPSVLIDGTRRALEATDYQLAERLARTATATTERAAATVLLAEALLAQARHDEADECFALAAQLATTDSERVSIAVARSHQRFWARHDTDAALAALTDAAYDVTSDGARDELLAQQASIRLFAGDTLAALDVAQGVRRRAASAEATAHALATVCQGLAMKGHLTDALAAVDEMLGEHQGVHRTYVNATPSFRVVRASMLGYRGEFADAMAEVEATMATMDPARWPYGPCCFITGQIYADAGRYLDARRYLDEAVRSLRDLNLRGHLAPALADLALVQAVLGDLPAARLTMVEALERRSPALRYAISDFSHAQTWIAGAEGRTRDAIAIALAAAGELGAMALAIWQARALHDAARLGAAPRVTRDLTTLARDFEGDFVPALAAHAVALERHDAGALDAVSQTFATIGSLLFAAEAGAEAATLHLRDGNEAAALASTWRAEQLVQRCGPVHTPTLTRARSARVLTDRELAVARLAAEGVTSADIAAQLDVSVRTVNNHLQHVYDRIGIHDREQLARLLPPSGGERVAGER